MLVVTNYKKLVINYSGSVNRTMNKKARNKVNSSTIFYLIIKRNVTEEKKNIITILLKKMFLKRAFLYFF